MEKFPDGYRYAGAITPRPLFDKPREEGSVWFGTLTYLDLIFDDLIDKRILEVAGGQGKTFEEALKYGLDWWMVDPLLGLDVEDDFKHNLFHLQSQPQYAERMETGLASQLPYSDKAFDITLSSWGIPLVCANDSDVQRSLSEMIRVTREKVVFNIFPDYTYDLSAIQAFKNNRTIIGQGHIPMLFALKDFLDNLAMDKTIQNYNVEDNIANPTISVVTLTVGSR